MSPLNLGTNFTYGGSRAKCQRDANARTRTKVNNYVVKCHWRWVSSKNWEQSLLTTSKKTGTSVQQARENKSSQTPDCLSCRPGCPDSPPPPTWSPPTAPTTSLVRTESCWPSHLDFSLLSPWAEKPVHVSDCWPTDWDNAYGTNKLLLF